MSPTEIPSKPRGRKTEIIAFSSGKGGTGKTLIATCLGYALTKIGLQVLMIDADLATDGLSLYLLGPDGFHKIDKFPLESTLTGILDQYNEQSSFHFSASNINRSAEKDHGVIYQAIISGVQLYGDRSGVSQEDASMHPDRESYYKVIQTIFDSLRSNAEFDYVIVDTRGGFSSQSTDVSALADSYIVVTEADVTSFYQNRNLIKYIDEAANEFGKKAVLRSIIVNKSTQFSADTKDFNLDNLESSFRLQLEREFPIAYKDTHPFPLSIEALRVQKYQQIPLRYAPDSDFSYAFFVAFHNILSVVTQPWPQPQVDGWNELVNSVNHAIEARNAALEKTQREEQEKGSELEKLRKDNTEYINRISSLERELKEIDERYKRELERSQLIVSKLESEKAAPVPAALKPAPKSRRGLTTGIVSFFTVAVLITAGMLANTLFFSAKANPTSTPYPTATVAISTDTIVPTAIATDTVPAGEPTSTPIPLTLPPATISVAAATQVDCPSMDPAAALPGNVAHFVGDKTVLPGTVIPRGQSFAKTWTIQNVGSVIWNTNYTFAVANAPDFQNFGIQHFSKFVKPGQCIDLSINLIAPITPGSYTGSWLLLQEDGKTRLLFDTSKLATLDVSIQVK